MAVAAAALSMDAAPALSTAAIAAAAVAVVVGIVVLLLYVVVDVFLSSTHRGNRIRAHGTGSNISGVEKYSRTKYIDM